jgi:hypothetical protein
MLAATVGVPYALWNGKDLTGGWLGKSDEKTDEAAKASGITPPLMPTSGQYPAPYAAYPPAAGMSGYGYPYAASGTPATDPAALPQGAIPSAGYTPTPGQVPPELHEALSLSATPAWVSSRWPRVTTTLAETNFDGLRVALTGIQETDLTGSLTYYFDKQQTAQRITFHGTTGNQQRLVELLMSQYGFTRQKCLAGELYTGSWMGRTYGMCRIRPAPVLSVATAPQRYEVLLEINRSGLRAKLSDAARQLLEQDRQARLW